jgi:hypothetical protein
MMDHPETGVVLSATLDAIGAWLRRPEAIVPRRLAGRDRRSALVNWSDSASSAVREEALSFGDGGRLFGILSEPGRGARTAVIFLNADANHRVGPNRLYVSLARDLAARGYPAFRFDVGGLGDSGPAPGMAENQDLFGGFDRRREGGHDVLDEHSGRAALRPRRDLFGSVSRFPYERRGRSCRRTDRDQPADLRV